MQHGLVSSPGEELGDQTTNIMVLEQMGHISSSAFDSLSIQTCLLFWWLEDLEGGPSSWCDDLGEDWKDTDKYNR